MWHRPARRQMKARQYVTPETLTLKERQSLLLALWPLVTLTNRCRVFQIALVLLACHHQNRLRIIVEMRHILYRVVTDLVYACLIRNRNHFFLGLIDTMADVVVF